MTKLSIKLISWLLLIFPILFSCKNNQNNDNFVKHIEYEKRINDKTLRFVLPDIYSDDIDFVNKQKQLPQFVDRDLIQQSSFVFFSQANEQSFFAFFYKNDSMDFHWMNYPENILLDSVATYLVDIYSSTHPGTSFIEKGIDNNQNPFCIVMSSTRYCENMGYDDFIGNLYQADSIKTDFMYISYFGLMGYYFVLSSIENIKEFSYKEKRLIIESISIE